MRAKILIVGDDPILTETRVGLLAEWQPVSSTSVDASGVIQLNGSRIASSSAKQLPMKKLKNWLKVRACLTRKTACWRPICITQNADFDAKRFEVQPGNPGAFRIAVAELLQGQTSSA